MALMIASSLTVTTPSLLHLRQRRLGLGQPEGHLHRTIEVDGSRQFVACPLPLRGLGVEGAETAVAVRLEGAHAKFVGQGERLAVVGCGLVDLWSISPCRNLPEEPQSIGLVATSRMLTGERQRALGEGVRLL